MRWLPLDSSFLFLNLALQNTMSTFNNCLNCWNMGNTSRMINTPSTEKCLQFLWNVCWAIIHLYMWWTPKRCRKAWQKRRITSQVFSPANADATMAWEKVSIITWTYFKWPNSGIFVTSVCHSFKGSKPLELVP